MTPDTSFRHDELALLTPVQTGAADRAAQAAGISGQAMLEAAGWPVRVALLGARETPSGDAAQAARRWTGDLAPFASESLAGAGVVVDAIFGAGLSRPVDGAAATA